MSIDVDCFAMPSPQLSTPGLQLNELVPMEPDANGFDAASKLADNDTNIDVIGGVNDNILSSTRPFYMQLHPMNAIDIVDDNANLNAADAPNVNNNNTNDSIYTTNTTNPNLNHTQSANSNDKSVVFLLFLK